MSTFSVSRRAMARSWWSLCAAGILALPVVAGSAHAAASRAADSSRTVREIRVTDSGILIDGRPQTSAERRASRAPATVEVRQRGVVVKVAGSVVDSVVESVRDRAGVRVHGPVVSVDGDGSDVVRVFADVHVREDERVAGDVVAVFGSAEVDGEVAGDVVAVFGSVKLGPRASVRGDAVAVGGLLQQADSAKVGGQTVSVGFLPISFGLPGVSLMLLMLLSGLVLTLLLGWLLQLIMPERMLRVAVTCSRRTGASLGLGLILPALVTFSGLLLMVTVIGLPLGLLLPVLYGLVLWGGHIAASYVLGSKVLRRPLGEGGFMLPLLVGQLFVTAFFVAGVLIGGPPGLVRSLALFFSLLGVLLCVGLATIGSGAFVISRFGGRPTDVGLNPPQPAPVGPPPAPGAVTP